MHLPGRNMSTSCLSVTVSRLAPRRSSVIVPFNRMIWPSNSFLKTIPRYFNLQTKHGCDIQKNVGSLGKFEEILGVKF